MANAYIGPRVNRYLGEIDAHLRGAGFRGSFLVVQSTAASTRSTRRVGVLRMLGSGRPPA